MKAGEGQTEHADRLFCVGCVTSIIMYVWCLLSIERADSLPNYVPVLCSGVVSTVTVVMNVENDRLDCAFE